MTKQNRIDVHHHFVPPVFDAAVKKHGIKEWPSPSWTLEASQALCQDRGIKTAIISLTSPGVDVVSTQEEQQAISRDANTVGSQALKSDPEHFGFFATIPNPVNFPDAALDELKHAFDTLHADGLTLLTSYSGKYLGHPAFNNLWAELNRRKAVVFIHPTSQPGDPPAVSKQLLPPALDFTFETTKTACDLILRGTVRAYPDVKIILSHAGGTLPFAWHRVANLPASMSMVDISIEEFREMVSQFYYDVALTGWGDNIDLLLKFAKKGHVLYGSDFPYAPNGLIAQMTEGFDKYMEGRDEALRAAVNWGDALDLFPRLKEYRY